MFELQPYFMTKIKITNLMEILLMISLDDFCSLC